MKALLNQNQDTKSSAPVNKCLFTLTGYVVQNILDKTVTVQVTYKFRHPVYRKTIFKKKKYLVHDPQNQAQINDQVLIANARKFSARKSFYLVKILKKVKISGAFVVNKIASTIDETIATAKPETNDVASQNKHVDKQ